MTGERGVTISADYLDTVDSLDATRRYKDHALRCLAPTSGQRLVDVGCGTGHDALAMAAKVAPDGSVLGIDISAATVEEARRRKADSDLPVRFEVMDGSDLRALRDASFDAARLDRILHPLPEPVDVLQEVVRVVRPGGRVVVSEPDWTTLTLDCDEPALSERIVAFARNRADSPGQGRCLGRLCAAAGLVDRQTHAWAGLVADYDKALKLARLDAIGHAAVTAGVIKKAELLRWLASLIRADRLGFLNVSMMLFTVVGFVPETRNADAGR